MAGTAKNYSTTEIHQGPGDLWVIGTAPDDTAQRLTLASDGTPDATAHPSSVHLGIASEAVSLVAKPKLATIEGDQFESALDAYVTDLEAKIETTLAQTASAKLQRALGVGTYSTGAGYKQVVFGGTLVVPKACIAIISQRRDQAKQYAVSLLYSAIATGGFSVALGRAKAAVYKVAFQGLADIARTAGRQVGVWYKTLQDAAGGTPTAKDQTPGEIYQGPVDLWAIDAPTDADQRVTLAADLTPDSVKHPNAKHLGIAEAGATFTVTPKIEVNRGEQFDAGIEAYVGGLEAKLECELSQSEMAKMARALGVGTTGSAAGYEQVAFGGTNQPATICVCAIGRKRSDNTKAVVCCLYKVSSQEGMTFTASKAKPSTYKVSFSGLQDPARTAGRQTGIFHEQI